MADQFTIKPVIISEKDEARVRDFKIKYINYITSLGVFYNPIRFVSAVMNNMIDHFNKSEDLVIPIGGFFAGQYDFKHIRESAVLFFDVLEKNVDDKALIPYIKDVFERCLIELKLMSDAKQKECDEKNAEPTLKEDNAS